MPPVFTRDADGGWSPGLYARGPFEGLQGGAVAALIAQAVEAAADGFVASVTTHFLKPAPLAPLRVTVRPLRTGRRVSLIDAEVSSAEGLVAVQRATVIAELPEARLPTPASAPADPEHLPRERRAAVHGGPWMMDTLDARVTDGMVWFRDEQPLFDDPSPLARVLVAADWAHGLFAPLGTDVRPPVSIPNTDLSVNLFRLPRGAWIGVQAQTAWSRTGVGAGWAALLDTEGLIGRVAMSVAVTPLKEPTA